MSSSPQTTELLHPAEQTAPGTHFLLVVFSLWWREMIRFYRQWARVVGVIASPLLFWIVIGSGFGTSFREAHASSEPYLVYFYPGSLIMIVLFTSIFTMMSVIQDRNEGFLLSVLVAPISRSAVVLGKVLGGTTLAAVQGLIFLIFLPAIGIHPGLSQLGMVAFVIVLTSFALTALGFAIAWRLDSAQAFHAIINVFLIPLWLLSGALFPLSGASGWLRIVMRANPLTYGVDALRMALRPDAVSTSQFSMPVSIAILSGFSLVLFGIALSMANRKSLRPAA